MFSRCSWPPGGNSDARGSWERCNWSVLATPVQRRTPHITHEEPHWPYTFRPLTTLHIVNYSSSSREVAFQTHSTNTHAPLFSLSSLMSYFILLYFRHQQLTKMIVQFIRKPQDQNPQDSYGSFDLSPFPDTHTHTHLSIWAFFSLLDILFLFILQ